MPLSSVSNKPQKLILKPLILAATSLRYTLSLQIPKLVMAFMLVFLKNFLKKMETDFPLLHLKIIYKSLNFCQYVTPFLENWLAPLVVLK